MAVWYYLAYLDTPVREVDDGRTMTTYANTSYCHSLVD